MARYTGPVCRMCRADGRKLMLKGQRCMSDKCPMNKKRGAPGKDPKQRLGKRSEYSLQLIEKQKIKRMYGLLEKQFHLAYEKATRMPGVTGENFIQLLERRLDNVVYRMHFAVSRSQARQLVLHGHILVNGKKIDIPSYLCHANDVISVKEKSQSLAIIKGSLEITTVVAPYLSLDKEHFSGTFVRLPERSELTRDINESLIVEYYNRLL